MSEHVETVFVLFPHGAVRVNKIDYRADMGPLCDADGNMLAPAAPVSEAPAAPAPSYGVEKSGRKFFIVNTATGNRIELASAEAAGYATEGEAWAAIMGLATAQ